MKYSTQFVIKVNEIFHDLESKYYEKVHPEILKDEIIRWENLFKIFVDLNKSHAILDIGTGTGFVPLTVGKFLNEEDYFSCSDLSKNILSVCQKNLSKTNYKCKFDYILLENGNLKNIKDKFDIITLNSVLHHIPDLDLFILQIKRLLKKGGIVIIGHEPNKLFFNNNILWYNYKILSLLYNPKRFIYELIQGTVFTQSMFQLIKIFKKDIYGYSNIYEETNKILINKKIINKPLSISEIQSIVDFHSPTAGKLNKNRGFIVSELVSKYFYEFNVLYKCTYNHLFKLIPKNKFLKKRSMALAKRFPNDGANLFVILKK